MKINIEAMLDEADVLISAFKYDLAIAKYSRILEHASDCADAFLMRGALLGEMGQLENAINDIENAIHYDQENDSSYLTLAYLYSKKNDDKKVLELSKAAVLLNNKNQEALKLFFKTSIKLGDEMLVQSVFDKAEKYYTEAIDVIGENAVLLYKLVLVLRGKGEVLDSIKMAERVIAADANHVRAKAHIASSYEIVGKLEQGNALIERLIQEYPDHPLVNIVYAQYALRNKNQQQGIESLTQLLKNTQISQFDLVSVKMLLGDLYDSIKEYEPAFSYYKQANDLLDENYDASSYTDYISTLINYYSKDKYPTIPMSNNTSDELIFIVGMPRSGTSLIEQIISSHSNVFGAGELLHVNIMANTLKENENFKHDFPFCLDEVNVELMDKLAASLISSSRGENNESLRIVDKMPHNFHHIGFIHKLLPNAKFINCVRDPRDTCLSIYFKHFVGHHPYANNFKNLSVHYKEYERLMNYWSDELGIPVHTVNYEKLVSDSKHEVETLLAFLNLEWEDSCMEFYKKKRTVATASYNQVNKKLYSSSMGRWKNYEKNITELIEALE